MFIVKSVNVIRGKYVGQSFNYLYSLGEFYVVYKDNVEDTTIIHSDDCLLEFE